MSGGKLHKVGIIMNGVTGRMGTNQHLLRSIMPIIKQGGVRVNDGERIMPNPVLVGRNPAKLEELGRQTGIANWTTDLDSVMSEAGYSVYFDAQRTSQRAAALAKAIEAGKHVYCEKPTAETAKEAFELHELAVKAGVKSGVVHDKLWLPGILKLKDLIRENFFGKILSVRGEFGYWVFDGSRVTAQRPSWNYRSEDGGGIILDMFPHWCYLLENLFGKVRSVCCVGATHIEQRVDEQGGPYDCTADDAAYATFELEGEIIAHINASWCVRVRRDDLLTLQVDGTEGSAVAGLRDCRCQAVGATPRPVWNPDVDNPIDLFEGWTPVSPKQDYENAFKIQWELFLRHVVLDEPFEWTLLEGFKGVQLANLALQSWAERRWLDLPRLSKRASPWPAP